MKSLRITINGKSFDVDVEVLSDKTPKIASIKPVAAQVAKSMPATQTATPAKTAKPLAKASVNDIACPLSATIIAINVKVGQSVKKGDQLITLEAMKMNTFVYSPKDGIVKEIFVQERDNVPEGAPLLSFE